MKEKFQTKQITSGLFWKFMERMSSQLVTFFVSIILARILTPKDYGTVALITVFITVANVFVTNGFGSALIQKKDVDNIDYSTVFYFNFVLSAAIYIVLFLTAPAIAKFYSEPVLTQVLRVVAIQIPMSAVNTIQQAYASSNMMFKKFFVATLGGTIASAAIGISMAYVGFGVWALVAQNLTSIFIGTVILWFAVRWRPNIIFSIARLNSLFNFGWKVLLSALAGAFYQSLRSIVIGKVYSSNDLGNYTRGNQFPNLLVSNINNSIIAVLFPVFSKVQDDSTKLKAMTRQSIRMSFYILSPLMIGLAAIAKPFIILLLTEKWIGATIYLQIACIYYVIYSYQSINLQAIKALGKSGICLKLETFDKVMGIFMLIIAMPWGVKSIAWSMVIAFIISSAVFAIPIKRELGYLLEEQIKDILPSILCACAMGVVIWFIGNFKCNYVLLMCIQICIGACIYFALSYLLKIEMFFVLRGMFFKKKGRGQDDILRKEIRDIRNNDREGIL